MEMRTYRAPTLQDALTLVRQELGPQAAVLHTREVREKRFLFWSGRRQIEVTASREVNVPSRFVREPVADAPPRPAAPRAIAVEPQPAVRDELKGQLAELQTMVEDLCRRTRLQGQELPESLFALYTDLIDAEVGEDLARELVEKIRREGHGAGPEDLLLLKSRVARLLEEDVRVAGPIRLNPGERRLVALVGPTGVGKTTTIAKLAANFRLRERRNVALITVDTYRIAAVEQLRTYADIIDLPMKVVSTPKEMRQAVAQFGEMDLVLLDTAGRSPKDEIKLQELRAFLSEAEADEVHLVLSSVSSAASLQRTAEQFAPVGTTALILTKLDEAGSLGNLAPLLRGCKLPLSYVTNGQNVPDDILPAEERQLARWMLGLSWNAPAAAAAGGWNG